MSVNDLILSSVVVLWEWEWFDGPLTGIGLYAGQPVYYEMDQPEEWQRIPLQEQAKYSQPELDKLVNLWSGQHYRYIPRSFKVYPLTSREFSEEEFRYHVWSKYRLRSEFVIDGILGSKCRFEEWLKLHPNPDYTNRPSLVTISMTDLTTWQEAYYWHAYHQLICFRTPSTVNWNQLAQTRLVPIQLLRFIARIDLYQDPTTLPLATYKNLCRVESRFWRERRARLAELASEAQLIGPMIMYQPGSQWVQPVMRDYFQPIPIRSRPMPHAYLEVAQACHPEARVSRGWLIFWAFRLGLSSPSWSRLSTTALQSGLQNYLRLLCNNP